MRRQWGIGGIVLLLLFGGIFGLKWLQMRNSGGGMGPPAVSVATVTAEAAHWAPEVGVVGTLSALQGAEITAQIAGNITAVAFRPGTRVAKGALLVQLDDSTERARLHADEAQLKVAATELARARELRKANATSDAALQSAEAAYGSAQAAVEGDKAALAKLRITAPFAGVVGVRLVSQGQYVSPGTPIVQLQNPDPLRLDFALPQGMLPQLQTGDTVQFTVDAYPGEIFRGRIAALDASVDPQTRNIAVQAVLRNPDGRLRPGLYGAVSMSAGAELAGVELPETAVGYSTFGDLVYVVQQRGEQPTALARHVAIIANRDGRVLIGKGVTAGEQVVAAGQHKLRDGSAVVVRNAAARQPAARP